MCLAPCCFIYRGMQTLWIVYSSEATYCAVAPIQHSHNRSQRHEEDKRKMTSSRKNSNTTVEDKERTANMKKCSNERPWTAQCWRNTITMTDCLLLHAKPTTPQRAWGWPTWKTRRSARRHLRGENHLWSTIRMEIEHSQTYKPRCLEHFCKQNVIQCEGALKTAMQAREVWR